MQNLIGDDIDDRPGLARKTPDVLVHLYGKTRSRGPAARWAT